MKGLAIQLIINQITINEEKIYCKGIQQGCGMINIKYKYILYVCILYVYLSLRNKMGGYRLKYSDRKETRGGIEFCKCLCVYMHHACICIKNKGRRER